MPGSSRSLARRGGMLALAVVLVATMVSPALAGFEQATGDAQGTWRGDGQGPVTPGLDWLTVLEDLEYNGRHGQGGVAGYGRPAVVDDDGHVLILADDTARGSIGDPQFVLAAVDTDNGTHDWTVDDVAPYCAPVVAPDGTIWAVREEALPGGADDLVSIDPATGAVTSRFSKTTETAADPVFTGCDSNYNAPLRLSPDGQTLYIFEHTYGGITSASWIRSLDISGATVTQNWILRLTPTTSHGAYGEWVEDMRIAPAGSPAAGTLYLFERTQGATDTGVGDDDVNWVHAIDPAAVPATADAVDAIDRSVQLPGTQLWSGAITLVDDALYLSLEEDQADRVPGNGLGVNARNIKVVDDGATLQVVATSLGRDQPHRGTADHMWHFVRLTAGDDGTLVGSYRGGRGIAAMDADTLEPLWSLADQGCLSGSVVSDVDGTVYFPCAESSDADEAIGAATVDGRLAWTFDTEAVHRFIGGTGRADLSVYDSFTVLAVTDDGKVVVSAMIASGAPIDGIALFAIDLGEAAERVAGTNRLETAVSISREIFPAGADTVVLAKAGDYPDALAGAPLAVAEGGPLLLSASAALSPVTEAEIRRLGASHAILLGGEAALSEAVRTRLRSMGLSVARIHGDNRFDTARLVKERLGTRRVVIVEGSDPDPSRGWPDAVAASAWAAATGRAILLVSSDTLPTATAEALAGVTSAVIVGGTGAVSAAVEARADAIAGTVERIFGPNRYATSVAVAQRSLADGNDLDLVWLATGAGFADALAAGPAAAFTHGVLLLINGSNPAGSPDVYDFLRDRAVDIGAVRLVGGAGAISPGVAAAVDAALGR